MKKLNDVKIMCNRYWDNGNTPEEVAMYLVLNGYINSRQEKQAIKYLKTII